MCVGQWKTPGLFLISRPGGCLKTEDGAKGFVGVARRLKQVPFPAHSRALLNPSKSASDGGPCVNKAAPWTPGDLRDFRTGDA